MYSKAADLYSGEEVTSTSNGCKLKVAQLSAQVEDYPTAVQLFTEVALSSLASNLLKYSVKGYLLCAGLAVLCSADSVGVANAIDKYVDMDATFEDSREHKLLVELAECMEGGDVDKFTSVVQEFDSMSRLDQWKTTMLLRAKKRCAAREMAGGAYSARPPRSRAPHTHTLRRRRRGLDVSLRRAPLSGRACRVVLCFAACNSSSSLVVHPSLWSGFVHRTSRDCVW